MSVKLMSLVWDSSYAKHLKDPTGKWKLSHTKLLVMLKLADHASEDGMCWPSQVKIAEACGISRQWVNRIIKVLADDGTITMVRKSRSNWMTLHFKSLPDISMEVQKIAEHSDDVNSVDISLDTTELNRNGNSDVNYEPSDVNQLVDTNHQLRTVIEDSVPTERGETPPPPPVNSDSPERSVHQEGMAILKQVIGPYPDGAAQGNALKFMLKNGATLPQIETELKRQKAESDRKYLSTGQLWPVSYLTVQKTIFQHEIMDMAVADLREAGFSANGKHIIPENFYYGDLNDLFPRKEVKLDA